MILICLDYAARKAVQCIPIPPDTGTQDIRVEFAFLAGGAVPTVHIILFCSTVRYITSTLKEKFHESG